MYLAYSRFINAMKQEPVIEQLLPLTDDKLASLGEKPHAYSWDYIYEPNAQTVLDELLKRYVEAFIRRLQKTWLQSSLPVWWP